MLGANEQRSEVARLLTQISAEYEATNGVRIPPQIDALLLDVLGLSPRILNSLRRSSTLMTVGQLLTMEEEDLRRIRTVGDKALQEMRDRLQAAGCFAAIIENKI